MIDEIVREIGFVGKTIVETPTIIWWFTGAVIAVMAYSVLTNHLSIRRLLYYAIMFVIFWVAIEGPKIHYAVAILGRSIDSPNLWISAIFTAFVLSSLLLGICMSYLINKSLALFLGDYWMKLATTTRKIADLMEKRSLAAHGQAITSWEELEILAKLKLAEKQLATTKAANLAMQASLELANITQPQVQSENPGH